MTNTTHTHAEQINNILANLKANNSDTRWQTENGYNDSLRAIEYIKNPIIAAAPELLDALEKGIASGWLRQELYDNAIAAIKKAKGEA
jgi:hypothetical protein